MVMRTHVDLCSGIGGFALGFLAAELSEPILFCDFDEKVRRLLRVRFPGIPIANDVKEIASDPRKFIRERPFILSSGYPCQPFSASGKRAGEEDPRHIFPHIAEIVAQTRPTYCVFENVYGHISLGLDKVLSQMGSLDYTTATFIVPAAGFRPHKRDRLWIICKNMANTNNEGIWPCERGSDVDNEGSSGERGANRGGSSSYDEWNDTQTTKDERMDVANTDSRCSDRENKEVRSRGEAIDSSGKRSGIVANTKGEGLQGWKFSTAIKSEEPRVSDTRTESSDGRSENVANTKSINRNEHELVRENGNLETQEVSGDRNGLSDSEGESTQDHSQTFASFRGIFDGISGWLDEPRHIQRTTHLNEYRAERLKQLGNALLPQITYRIGLAIKECEDDK
jgi:site-specific DNA-cytosine methylase